MSVLVTGGAGFIGSHLVDKLIDSGLKVKVFDNLSTGNLGNLKSHLVSPNLRVIRGDLLRQGEVAAALDGCETVFHIAANPEVRSWLASPQDHFRQNIEATFNLLEAVRDKGEVEVFAFTSSSTVYGEPEVIPTPEDYAPLKPVSLYGASKLAAEAMISAYASLCGFRCVILRLANVVGDRCSHGAIFDFAEKLRNDPRELEVLGDGTQSKSYLHVSDCVEGMIIGVEKARERIEILNIGSGDRVDVLTISRIVMEEMGLKNVVVRLTGGVDGGRGWKGDVKTMQLDTRRLRSLGWSPKLNSAEAVRATARALLKSTVE